MSKIVSIATGVPRYRYRQGELFSFADKVYSKDAKESRKLKFLYDHSGIAERYSVLPDFNLPAVERSFFSVMDDLEPFPTVENRMKTFNSEAVILSMSTIEECIKGKISKQEITHLITVTCTGLSAPGLDLQVMEEMDLPRNIVRTSINFMGCYAAIQAMKMADAFCNNEPGANVIIVCTELCTLHFQKNISPDNITASLLFGDGCSALLVQNNGSNNKGIRIKNFFSDVSFKGKKDMAWQISSVGFLMTLTGYIPDLIKEDFKNLADKAFKAAGVDINDITHWCIHPGGKKILEAIAKSTGIKNEELQYSYDVLHDYGNMSSATILFVLKKILADLEETREISPVIFGAAFGPGLTMETFIATYD
ncbi:MAG: type III polyketide synthase [Ferruginibacter sp.]